MRWRKRISVRARSLCLVLYLLGTVVPAHAGPNAPPAWAIATAHPLATAAGFEVANSGGNAFDAAIAISAALSVVEPMGSGLGGGGFWLLHRSRDGFETMVDGREQAPSAAHRNMYLDENGEPRPRASLDGALAAGIPGQAAALVHIAQRYGRLKLSDTLAPAIRYAEKGFVVTPRYQRLLELRLNALDENAAAVFTSGGYVPKLGATIRQPELAQTLRALADRGNDGFYDGPVAKKLVAGVRRAGGIWTLEDLKNYRVKERAPIIGQYRGVRIVSAPPPSSGGIVLVSTLNILERWDSVSNGLTGTHRIIEAWRRAYHDRARYLADPDFVSIDVSKLIGKEYARKRAANIQEDATSSAAFKLDAGEAGRPRGANTTHLSIFDDQGNRVAATLSINYFFGSGVMPAGTGVLLNNEMDDFVIKPGTANEYGLTGNEANTIAPGKRPLSSMTPTFLQDPERVVVLGTPGGSRIISMVTLAVLELIENGWDIEAAVGRPRFHHQYVPDEVSHEADAFSQAIATELILKGHTLQQVSRDYGDMHAVMWDRRKGVMYAVSDPRGEGSAQVAPSNTRKSSDQKK